MQAKAQHETAQARDWLWVVVQFALIGAILLAPRLPLRRSLWPQKLRGAGKTLGGGAVLGGALLVGLSARDLGANLTPNPRPVARNQLVQSGVYALVRHPMYSGLLLLALGWSLLRANIPALLLSGLLGLFFDAKARHEEQYLAARHPAYGAYQQRVRRLVPWIW